MRTIGTGTRRGLVVVAAALVGGCAASGGTAASSGSEADAGLGASVTPAGCEVDVIVQFAPYIAAPGSQAFVAELVAGSGYHLRYVRSLGTSHVLRLTGQDSTCDAGLELLRREPRIKSLEIDERQFHHAVRTREGR